MGEELVREAACRRRERKLPVAVPLLLYVALPRFAAEALPVVCCLVNGRRWLGLTHNELTVSTSGVCQARYQLGATGPSVCFHLSALSLLSRPFSQLRRDTSLAPTGQNMTA